MGAPLSSNGAYVFSSAGPSIVAGTSFQSNLDGSGRLTVALKPPASLGPGIYSDVVQIWVCFDAACTKPAVNSAYSIPISYVVDAVAGSDFTIRTIPNEVVSMAWSAANQRIYAIAPGAAISNPNSLLVINPVTAVIESVVPLSTGTSPTGLALSDDGQYAYVDEAVGVSDEVVRVHLSDLTTDETFQFPGACEGIAVAPGLAHSVAIACKSTDIFTINVYDDATRRTQGFTTNSPGIPLLFTWGADATTLYTDDPTFSTSNLVPTSTMYQLSAASGGLSSTRFTPGLSVVRTGGDVLQFVGGLVYSSSGGVFDPLASLAQAPFNMQDFLGTGGRAFFQAVDPSLDRAYFLSNGQSRGSPNPQLTIESFDLTTRQPRWLTRFDSDRVEGSLIRWGNDGLAFESISGTTPSIVLISGGVVLH